ncbi:hypothetical protein [Terrisporobacter petrolearius]|uniref:family 4 glycosyl hydrolase n=1 Tax=Terrisporobacter petrolearius TaxID=1460447 RepID=UPI0031CC665F
MVQEGFLEVLVSQIKSFESLAAKAVVTGDYETVLLALCINPLVPWQICHH